MTASQNSSGAQSGKKRATYLASVPPQEILPVVNDRYESTIPGIYLIGDVTGVPLVKVAANQGKEVIERLLDPADQGDSDQGLDLVIVGAGPAGISAAIEASKRNLKYVVLERARAASTVRGFPEGKKVYAEPRSIPNHSELNVGADRERNEFVEGIENAIAEYGLAIKENAEVTQVKRLPDGSFEVLVANDRSFPCRKVIVAVGRQGQPRTLDVPGADNCEKVTYKFHTVEDYKQKKVLVVGGGNSAIEAALMLSKNNDVTLSYRGSEFYRAKKENRELVLAAASANEIRILFQSRVREIKEHEVDLDVRDQETITISNDNVVVQIGTLPPVDFLVDMGIELDGVWTKRRFLWSAIGLVAGLFIYFWAKYFVLLPERAGDGKWLIPGSAWLGLEANVADSTLLSSLNILHQLLLYVLPVAWLGLLGLESVNWNFKQRKKKPLLKIKASGWILGLGALLFYLNIALPSAFTVLPSQAGGGPYYLPGLTWLFRIVPAYFSNLSGFYYLLYFGGITVFGLFWAIRINKPILWRRNLTIIGVQWTLWWGIPTFLVVFIGTNPWTPLVSRALNAWPLKMDAFQVDTATVRPGDPAWWYAVGVVGVLWAVVLTFIIIPLFTIKFGKIYCSYICSCGALAETVGNSFRHRGPKGDLPRKLEKIGFVFVLLASIATIADLIGFKGPLQFYNVWVGTLLAGAIAIGMYPFLGQRIWCRMWCPLAFWMNFWGRWSQFRISPEPGKCIDCNICNQYCQMGIDIKGRALQGLPVTLKDTPCVGCAECVMRCPMEILHLGDVPDAKLVNIQMPEAKQ